MEAYVMTLRHRSRVVAAGFALVFAACVGVAVAQPASAAPAAAPAAAAPGATLVPLKVSPATIKPNVAAPQALVSDTCGTVRANLQQYVARHIQQAGCLTVTRSAARKTASVAAQVSPADASWCSQSNGDWYYDRTEECAEGGTVTETVIDPDTGLITGTASFTVNQDILLSPTSGIFTENDSVTMAAAVGTAAVPGTLEFTSGCGSPCGVLSNGNYAAEIHLGETDRFAISYEDTPTATTPDKFLTNYVFDIAIPDVFTTEFATWGSGANIRCDAQLGGQPTGCVFSDYPPSLQLSVATYGAAAVNVEIGENYLVGNPGWGAPLTRGDPADTDSNRDAICDGTFLATTLVPNDSCDEYPFASSQQSGGAIGLTGSSCAEALPINLNGVWYVEWFKPYLGTEQCLRGHVPSDQNSAVGSQLSSLINTNRVLIGDPYWVAVTS
jgi:hypothetical protein